MKKILILKERNNPRKMLYNTMSNKSICYKPSSVISYFITFIYKLAFGLMRILPHLDKMIPLLSIDS